jgi:hypothetical protein
LQLIPEHTPAASSVSATVQVGDNSDQGADVEFTLDGASAQGQRTWDPDLSNGFDSGPVGIWLSASAGGGPNAVSFSVGGGALSSDIFFNLISSVEISANGKNGGTLAWSEVTITFYKNGQQTQIIVIPIDCAPVGGPHELILQITPDSDDNTGVLITGTVRLARAGTTLPASDDMSGVINILTG